MQKEQTGESERKERPKKRGKMQPLSVVLPEKRFEGGQIFVKKGKKQGESGPPCSP